MERTFSDLPNDEGNADPYCNEIPFCTCLLEMLRRLSWESVISGISHKQLVETWIDKATLESYLALSTKVEYSHNLQPSNSNARYKLLTYEPGGICKPLHGNIVVTEKNLEAIQMSIDRRLDKVRIHSLSGNYTAVKTHKLPVYTPIWMNLSKITLCKEKRSQEITLSMEPFFKIK